MTHQKPSKAASQLQALSKALTMERQLHAMARDLTDKISRLQKQKETVEVELSAIQQTLNADPDLTLIARQLMQKASAAGGGRKGGLAILNPKYVRSDAKRELLLRILQDHRQENPEDQEMTYLAIKSVLQSRYGIETASAGLFFRNELKKCRSKGGNKNKSVVLEFDQLQDAES